MKTFAIAAGIALSLAGTAVAEVKTASTPTNPALAIAVPGPADSQSASYTRTAAAAGSSLPNAADPSRATTGAAAADAVTGTRPAPARHGTNTGKPDVSISCVPNELKAVIREIEQRWGDVQIISGYRKGATIRGTGKPSKHASCQAVDFKPAPGTYNAVARWLKENHSGGVGTYSGHFHHIHIDVGPKLSWHN